VRVLAQLVQATPAWAAAQREPARQGQHYAFPPLDPSAYATESDIRPSIWPAFA
jgi:hypothetical protein